VPLVGRLEPTRGQVTYSWEYHRLSFNHYLDWGTLSNSSTNFASICVRASCLSLGIAAKRQSEVTRLPLSVARDNANDRSANWQQEEGGADMQNTSSSTLQCMRGEINCLVSMSTSASLRQKMLGFLLAMLVILCGATTVSASVKLAPKVGPPTTKFTVSGSGFDANVAIDIYFDTTEVALVVTNNTGGFSRSGLLVPNSAVPGTHWITVLERGGTKAGQASFRVRTDWPQAGFSPQQRSTNPYENVLSTSTVLQADLLWSYPSAGMTYDPVAGHLSLGRGRRSALASCSLLARLKASRRPAVEEHTWTRTWPAVAWHEKRHPARNCHRPMLGSCL